MVERELVLEIEPAVPSGVVTLAGAKNSALRLLVASLLTDEPVRLDRFPTGLLDVQVQLSLLENLGKRVNKGDDWCEITTHSELPTVLQWEGRSIRNMLLVLGALLARRGEGRVPLPGGCDIGARPFDLHEGLFRSLGAEVWVEDGQLCAKHPKGRLDGGKFVSPMRSTGVTENALICGALIPDGLELENPHLTPEVLDLIGFLRRAGVTIDIRGSQAIRVHGRDRVRGIQWTVIPDRMEGVTWAAAAIAGRGDIEIVDFPVEHTAVTLEHLKAAGAKLYIGERSIIVRSDGPQPISLLVGSHPAVHSDMQPLFGVLGALAVGRTELVDLRYPGRFAYLDDLATLGANSTVQDGVATIDGIGQLDGGRVSAADLRAGAALTVAGIGASSLVTIAEAWQVLRGYEGLVDKLKVLGVPARLVAPTG